VTNLVDTMIANAKTLPAPVLAEMKKHFIAGWGGYPIVGTPEQIADSLVTLSKIGLNGTLLNFPRYIDDMRRFQRDVYRLVKQAGLR
jgi:alkanesulfonate monooxygenase SsuD/methylene tetrahydromethanopterin reductase-like flavin-dependent oxidoreductase (luciferase family)